MKHKSLNKKHLRSIIIIASTFLILWLSLMGYCHLVEHRSTSSFVAEKFLWIHAKKGADKQSMEKYNNLLAKRVADSSKTVKNPSGFIHKDVTEDNSFNMQTFMWNDNGSPDQRVIIYIHGGSYVSQPLLFQYTAANDIADMTDARIVFPVYPLAPTHTYTESYADMIALYKYVLTTVNSPSLITLMGDSAGGGFALGLAHELACENIAQPKDIILISPWVDAATDNPDIANYENVDPVLSGWTLHQDAIGWAGSESNLDNPLVSPIHSDKFASMGRITLITGTHEIFYPDISLLDQKLTTLGIEHNLIVGEKMNHIYPVYPIPEGKAAREEISSIILSN